MAQIIPAEFSPSTNKYPYQKYGQKLESVISRESYSLMLTTKIKCILFPEIQIFFIING